jgi:hypothetical protein
MSESLTPTKGPNILAPRPKGWLEREFGIGKPVESAAPRPFDFSAMRHSLASLERKTPTGE